MTTQQHSHTDDVPWAQPPSPVDIDVDHVIQRPCYVLFAYPKPIFGNQYRFRSSLSHKRAIWSINYKYLHPFLPHRMSSSGLSSPPPPLQLINIPPHRFQHLVTQMQWRLSEGGGSALYLIGVEDDGFLAGALFCRSMLKKYFLFPLIRNLNN